MFNWRGPLHNVFPFHHSAWKATVQPISALLNETNKIHQDELTEKWYKNMVSHLQVVLIAVCLQTFEYTKLPRYSLILTPTLEYDATALS